MTLNLYSNFVSSTETAKLLYNSAIYGKSHNEVKMLKLIEKFGMSKSRSLLRKDLQQAVKEVAAINDANKDQENITIDFTSAQVKLIKSMLRDELKRIRSIPKLAGLQLIVSLSASFEGFVSDLILEIFDADTRVLKTGKSTLKDAELIDALTSGDAIEVLKRHRLRDIMYGSPADWFSYLSKTCGIKIENTNLLIQMFLIRNAIVHNNACVTPDLIKIRNRRYLHVGKQINVTEKAEQQFAYLRVNTFDS